MSWFTKEGKLQIATRGLDEVQDRFLLPAVQLTGLLSELHFVVLAISNQTYRSAQLLVIFRVQNYKFLFVSENHIVNKVMKMI